MNDRWIYKSMEGIHNAAEFFLIPGTNQKIQLIKFGIDRLRKINSKLGCLSKGGTHNKKLFQCLIDIAVRKARGLTARDWIKGMVHKPSCEYTFHSEIRCINAMFHPSLEQYIDDLTARHSRQAIETRIGMRGERFCTKMSEMANNTNDIGLSNFVNPQQDHNLDTKV